MNEFLNSLKSPFTELPESQRPRPLVMAVTWSIAALIIRALLAG